MIIERLAYKPLRQAAPLAVLITAIGVSYFLQNAALLHLGPPRLRPLPRSWLHRHHEPLRGAAPSPTVAIVTIGVPAHHHGGADRWFTGHTKMGKAMRAVSEDKAAAQLMGINVNGTISVTFAIGSALAAIAGVLLAPSTRPACRPPAPCPASRPSPPPCSAASAPSPAPSLGGLLLGIIEAMAKAYISTSLANSIVFARADRGAARQARRPAWQVRPGEGVRCRYVQVSQEQADPS